MAITTILNILRQRGDTLPFNFEVDEDGSDKDITGITFLMTIDPSPAPANSANNLFQLTESILVALEGKFQFTPSAANMDQLPDTYYYDVQMTEGAAISTIVKGKFTIEQDITK